MTPRKTYNTPTWASSRVQRAPQQRSERTGLCGPGSNLGGRVGSTELGARGVGGRSLPL